MARFVSLVALVIACKSHPGKPSDEIKLDGELSEPAWRTRAERHLLLGDDGQPARPYSEVRVLRGGDRVYLGLYAADEDIRSDDAFDVTLGARTLHLSAGAPGVDHDGTIDQPDDFDEEWVVEVAVPVAELGPPPYKLEVTRCDTTKDGIRRCAAWRGTATVSP